MHDIIFLRCNAIKIFAEMTGVDTGPRRVRGWCYAVELYVN
jgi:hypothetical protein